MSLQRFDFSRKTYLKCYISSYILICQPQPFVPLAIKKNCARDLSISKSWNHEPLYVLKRTVTLLNGFQPLGLQIKEGVLQLANQGGCTSTCKSRREYIGLQITTLPTFQATSLLREVELKTAPTCCAKMLCENAVQIHAVQIYAVQYMLSRVPQLTCNWMSLPGASGLGKLTTSHQCVSSCVSATYVCSCVQELSHWSNFK